MKACCANKRGRHDAGRLAGWFPGSVPCRPCSLLAAPPPPTAAPPPHPPRRTLIRHTALDRKCRCAALLASDARIRCCSALLNWPNHCRKSLAVSAMPLGGAVTGRRRCSAASSTEGLQPLAAGSSMHSSPISDEDTLARSSAAPAAAHAGVCARALLAMLALPPRFSSSRSTTAPGSCGCTTSRTRVEKSARWGSPRPFRWYVAAPDHGRRLSRS